MLIEHYFSALGKFLYALSVSDGAVQEKELKCIDLLVDEKIHELKNTTNEEFIPFIVIMKMSFYNGVQRKQSAHAAASELINFLNEHSEILSSEQRDWAWDFIERIAHSFKGIGQSEMKWMESVKSFLHG